MGYKNKTIAEYSKEYRKKSKYKKSAWITKVYGRMKRDNKNKFDLASLPFSKEEFVKWLDSKYCVEFDKLFSEWVNSGFLKNKVPSIDRIDDYQSYTFENMQLLTWEENDLKGRLSEKNKKQMREMTKKIFSKPVIQINIDDGSIVNSFPSAREAGRCLSIDASGISACCRGELKYSKGFVWRYSNENN